MNARLYVLYATSHASKIVVEISSCEFLSREETTMRTSQRLASFAQAREFMRRYMLDVRIGPPVDIAEKRQSAEA